MVAYASYTAQEFLKTPDDLIFARLVQSDAVSGFSQFSHKQGWSWGEAIRLMKAACERLLAVDERNSGVGVVLEYRIPRREKRLDAAFLFRNTVAVIEFKAGSASATSESVAQVSDYCLDLAYYHAQSQGKRIVPIVCSTEAQSSYVLPASEDTPISDVHCVGGLDLSTLLMRLASEDLERPDGLISHQKWCSSSYRPIPGIIETTVSLFNKHGSEDIEAALAVLQHCQTVVVSNARYAQIYHLGEDQDEAGHVAPKQSLNCLARMAPILRQLRIPMSAST